MAAVTETLTNTSLFSGLAPDDLEEVASQTVIKKFPKNTVLVGCGRYRFPVCDYAGQGRCFSAKRQG